MLKKMLVNLLVCARKLRIQHMLLMSGSDPAIVRPNRFRMCMGENQADQTTAATGASAMCCWHSEAPVVLRIVEARLISSGVP